MKLLKQFICVALALVLALSVGAVALAAEAITINAVTIQEYKDEYGTVDEDLVKIVVEFTMTNASDQMTLLLTSENITEISAATATKIIFMDQSVTPEGETYSFNVEKSKIKEATGLEDIEGCNLYVKMGAKGVSSMATKTVTYQEPSAGNRIAGDADNDGEITNLDGTYLLRYLAEWELENINVDAMDVDGDGEVTNLDGTYLLRYLAGWDIELA